MAWHGIDKMKITNMMDDDWYLKICYLKKNNEAIK